MLTGLLLAATSLAQIDPCPDGIGIYFDQEATQVTATAELGETVVAYLIATNPSQVGGLALWEGSVFTPVFEVVIWGSPSYGINLANNMPPGGPSFSFLVTPDPPLPALQPIFVLATLDVTVWAEGPIGLHVGGYSFELPMYRVDDPYGQDHSLYPASGSVDLPVAVINGDPPIPVEPGSWGQLKTLYR